MKPLTISELHSKVELQNIKGFLAADEAAELWTWAREIAHLGPCLEIGSYCGKSTVYLAEGCREVGSALYAVDHHRGSEEHQVGEEYHDSDLFDAANNAFNSFPTFMRTLETFDLLDVVIPVVARSEKVAKHWRTPLAMVFVDGGHSHAAARHDCLEWSKSIVVGGILAVHDIFEKPEEGGQGPYLGVQAVLAGGQFEWIKKTNSLGILRKIQP